MKNYFNEKERTNHIIVMCMEHIARDFANSNALTENERNALLKISENCEKLNESVFDRFGEAYKRKVYGTLQNNTLRRVGKYGSFNNCISYCASEDIQPKVKSLMCLHCLGCKKEDYKNCAIYSMAVTCGIVGDTNEGCPYNMGDDFYEE